MSIEGDPLLECRKASDTLTIHTTTNDEDVNVLEVEHLIRSH